MQLLATICSLLIAVSVVAIDRGTDGDQTPNDVVADLGEDLAARILKEREQLKRQNKELRQQLAVAQHFADQRAAMLQSQNRAEHDKVSNLQQSLSSVQTSLKQAQQMETNLQNILHNKGVALPLPPGTSVPSARHRHDRPVTSLQQASSEKPSHHQAQKPKSNSKHPKVSKAALTAIRTKLASVTFSRKNEEAHLASIMNKSKVLEAAYAQESGTLKAEINQSNVLLATVKQNDKLLEEMRARYNKTSVDASRTKQALAWTKQQTQRLQQMHKQDVASLKGLNQTTSKLRGQLNKLNQSLTKVQGRAKHDEDVEANKTKQMKATLEKKLNALNHTDEDYSKKDYKGKKQLCDGCRQNRRVASLKQAAGEPGERDAVGDPSTKRAYCRSYKVSQ
jgi:chromosome segregation ATPase